MTSPNPPRPNLSALGWLLAVPALLGALITLVLPTVQTLWLSFQSGGVMRESAYVGTANYADLLGDGAFWRALGFTLSLTLLPLLVAVVVAPLLALALDRAGAWPRRAGRVVLSLAVVTFSPVAVAGAWTRGLSPESSGLAALAQGLREPDTAPWTLRLIVAAGTFGIVCALAVLAYLPALRGGSAVPATLAVAALVLLATVATGVQTFSIGMVLTRGGPQHATETLAGLQYDYAFRMARFGPGAAVAALSGVILGVLGVVATLVAVLSRLRITLTPRLKQAQGAPALKGGPVPHDPFGIPGVPGPHGGPVPHGEAAPYGGAQAPQGVPASHGSPAAPGGAYGAGIGSPAAPGGTYGAAVGRRTATPGWVAAGAVALLIFAAAWVLLSWPWIDGVLATPSAPASTLRTQVNTWVPALAGALVSVGVAYLAALGIGGLRPLGRGSEWLLLAFAPWLFVGPGPLGVANWQNARNLGLIDSFPALVPPLLVSVPALLVLTLLCKGLSERSGGDFFGGVLLPSLPMAGILAGAVTLVNAHDLSWPLLVAQQADLYTTPVSQVTRLGSFAGGTPDIGAATPLLVVAVALAALVAAQLLYLDRLAVTTNGSPVRTDAA
ncbi:carbohydrate ABC transporter permease [Nonomuraea fuscirosea]|uniref:carbohydrate ABC transporter permease n=1 Tax=Nonomuraea fuscirosea TaxID=1291556 RepID=UPI0037155412